MLRIEHSGVGTLHAGDPGFLGGEPALLRQVVGIDVAEQCCRLAALGNRLHSVAHDQRDELRQRLGDRLMPVRNGLLVGQEKPIEAVAVQRQQVG